MERRGSRPCCDGSPGIPGGYDFVVAVACGVAAGVGFVGVVAGVTGSGAGRTPVTAFFWI